MSYVAKRKQSRAAELAASLNQRLGSDVVGLASDKRYAIERVPIGILTMERITGGGFPRGRHVELFGDESSGKSYATYMTMALAQQRGEICALVDPEKIFDLNWFTQLGGDPSELLMPRCRTAEEIIQVLMLFAEGDEEVADTSIVTIDSVSALLPLEELKKDPMEHDQPGSQARMMSRLLRRVTAMNENTLFLWTNQLREKIGRVPMPPTTSGGRALRFYATTRIEMKNGTRVKRTRKKANTSLKMADSEVVVGRWVLLRSEKEKSARPYQQSMFYWDAERGCVDQELEIIHLGLEDGLITRHGNSFHYEDSDGNEWSGVATKFKQILRKEEEVREELVWAVSEKSRMIGSEDQSVEE